MPSIRRYGPALVTPQVSPRPELGRGREQMFAAFQETFDAAQQFIRPAVVQVQTARGEREAAEALENSGPFLQGGRSSAPDDQEAAARDDQELSEINGRTFEPRLPYTVRSAAFNASADRIITARAMEALEQGLAQAVQNANGNLPTLTANIDALRANLLAQLPENMPGIATQLQIGLERGRGVAERAVVRAAQAAAARREREARDTVLEVTRTEAERMALTGATPDELAAHMTQATEALVQYGPREAFTINGQEYPADPTRAGLVSAESLEGDIQEIAEDARLIMFEADFMTSEAPGQYMEEFRQQVFSGNSPFSPSESLELLRTFEARARAAETRLQAAAEAARETLLQESSNTINSYVTMTEAGVPVAIPMAERLQILSDLAQYPEDRQAALTAFAVADAMVETHGMSGPELLDYVDSVRQGMISAAEGGILDLEGAAIIEELSGRVTQIQDTITAEMVGLPMVEQLAARGGLVEDVDYEALRERAAGNQDVLAQINEMEAFHRDAQAMSGMNANDREALLERGRQLLRDQAATGETYGAGQVATARIMDRLEEWSGRQQEMAASDPVTFAAARGIALPGFEGAETMADVAGVIAERIGLVAPAAMREGAANPVPLTQAEIDGISEVFEGSTRSDRASFLGAIAELGEDQAMAVFSRIGQTDPVIYAAGAVYTMGNRQAASVILRGATDVRLNGGGPTEVAAARQTVLSPLFMADMIAPEGIEALDTTALAYARGLAMAGGGRDIEPRDLENGYHIALGRQADGTGGLAETRYGATILPPAWDARRLERTIRGLTDTRLTEIARGLVVDIHGRPFSASDLRYSIEGLMPSPDDPYILVPVDADGAVFLTDDGSEQGVLSFDLREFD